MLHKRGIARYDGPTKTIGWRIPIDIKECGQEIAEKLAKIINYMWVSLELSDSNNKTTYIEQIEQKFKDEILLVQKILPLEEV